MKKFGFMLMAAAVAVMSFTSCEKKNNNDDVIINPPVEDEVKLPSVEATAGAVTLVVKFDQAPCEGYDIIFVGSYEGCSWSFADALAMESIGDGWYKVVLKPGEVNADNGVCISGRPIQNADRTSEEWDKDWSHDGADLIVHKGASDSNIADSGFGEINLNFTEADAADGLVAYLESKKWNLMPCASATEYNVTVIVPAFCGEEFNLEVVGGFEGWGTAPVALTKVEGTKYTAKVAALEGQEWKVRGEGNWEQDIEVLVPGDPANDVPDSWKGVDNNKFGADLNVTVDYSDPAQYRWKGCE